MHKNVYGFIIRSENTSDDGLALFCCRWCVRCCQAYSMAGLPNRYNLALAFTFTVNNGITYSTTTDLNQFFLHTKVLFISMLYLELLCTFFGEIKKNTKSLSSKSLMELLTRCWSSQTFFFIKWIFFCFFAIKLGHFIAVFCCVQTLKFNIKNWNTKKNKDWWFISILSI